MPKILYEVDPDELKDALWGLTATEANRILNVLTAVELTASLKPVLPDVEEREPLLQGR